MCFISSPLETDAPGNLIFALKMAKSTPQTVEIFEITIKLVSTSWLVIHCTLDRNPYEAVYWAMYVPVPKVAKLKSLFSKCFFWLLLVFLLSYGHNGQHWYKRIGPTRKLQYIVLRVGNPFSSILMVKRLTSCHISQILFTGTSWRSEIIT